jgi:hypothetical protein
LGDVNGSYISVPYEHPWYNTDVWTIKAWHVSEETYALEEVWSITEGMTKINDGSQVSSDGWVYYPYYDGSEGWLKLKGTNVLTGEEIISPDRRPYQYGKASPASLEHPNLILFQEGTHVYPDGNGVDTDHLHMSLWDKDTGEVRIVTDNVLHHNRGMIVPGTSIPRYLVLESPSSSGEDICLYVKDMISSGILTEEGHFADDSTPAGNAVK